MNTNNATPRRMLRPSDAAWYLGFSRATLYRLCKEGKLPKPVHISRRAVAWDIAVLDAYLAAQA